MYARPAAQGLVAAWAFDENAGTTAADATGGGHNGTVSNATWTAGRYGAALSFNGSSSIVRGLAHGRDERTRQRPGLPELT
ncbi:MAG: hypothetical protein ACRD15_08570 [Vicinamibacterales bacterium]